MEIVPDCHIKKNNDTDFGSCFHRVELIQVSWPRWACNSCMILEWS